MKKVLLISLVLVLGLAASVWADMIPVPESAWNDYRTTPNTSGVVSADGWVDSVGGVKIFWEIDYDSTLDFPYSYTYTITDKNGTALNPELSHWILEVSSIITSDNFNEYIDFPVSYDIVGPETFVSSGTNGDNPNMPAGGIYGIKFDFGQASFSFSSTQIPVWGDFYLKDGKHENPAGTKEPATAWNTGFGTDPTVGTTDFTLWIPVPDTNGDGDEQDVPEPSTLLLIGTGLLGLGLYRRGKFRK